MELSTDFDPATGIDPGSGIVNFGGADKVLVQFYRGTKRDNFKSQELGYPVEVGVDMLKLTGFGERSNTIKEVDQADKLRYPRQWAAYQAGREQIQDGTPLDLLFPKNPEIVSTLKGQHIHTIQALAQVPASSNIPFLTEWQKKAEIFLDGINKGQKFHELERKLEDADLANKQYEARISELEKTIAELAAGKKAKE